MLRSLWIKLLIKNVSYYFMRIMKFRKSIKTLDSQLKVDLSKIRFF